MKLLKTQLRTVYVSICSCVLTSFHICLTMFKHKKNKGQYSH